jgi:glutamyl-tRNA synthetase
MPDDLKLLARKHALHNALKYNGSANAGAVIGKLIQVEPGLKKDMKATAKTVAQVIAEVNRLGVDKQLAELKEIAPELLEEKPKEEVKVLKPLPDAVKGKVVMRAAPSPSGPLHIGHALVFSVSSEYCRMYDGKLMLRIEDTNPENIYEPAYHLIPEDLHWVTKGNLKEVTVQSDRLGTYYDHAENIIAGSGAYVCTCSADVFRDFANSQKACPCRDKPAKEHLLRWKRMFGEYEPGAAVVRIKTDLNDPNPAMRDWPALRINHHTHPKKGTDAKVWPLMNFAVAIDDHDLGVTHTIRGKDHMDNGKRQEQLQQWFGWKPPVHLYFGRINFVGMELSCTKTKQAIQRKEYDDWDDIRLPFLLALRRRGYQPEAFIQYAVDMGVNQNDKTVPVDDFFGKLDAYNRQVLEPLANRYFFVEDPVDLTVTGAPPQKVELDLHPDDHARGKRTMQSHEEFYIPKADAAKLRQGKLFRLMDCLNFTMGRGTAAFDSLDHEKYREHGEAIMHWLPKGEKLLNVEVLMPDKTVRKGLGEPGLAKLKPGTIVQLERFGFCRLDSNDGRNAVFWFCHR